MIEQMPQGISIGTMQASMDWLNSHTSRFIGAVFVRIQDGKGYILIQRGEPLAHYFTSGTKTLRGKAAREYFTNERLIDFDMRKYTSGEFENALALSRGEPVAAPEPSTGEEAPPGDVSSSEAPAPTPEVRDVYAGTTPLKAAPSPESGTAAPPVTAPESDELAELRNILTWPGVKAASIFENGLNLHAIGGYPLDNVVAIGEDAVRAASTLSLVLNHGRFVQMTIELPSGTIIITPYRNTMLCILTTDKVHLGQIRNILQDIQQRLQD
jgi:predicted regulator of Ras-like GTPase activity (Roadblock/LC7/MglB family)